MGLSNDERLLKFFWTAQNWRKNLNELANKVGDACVSWYTNERCATVVQGWISTIDTLVGIVHLKSGGGGAYWLMGENDNSLRGLLSEPYRLDGYESLVGESEFETVGWWVETANCALTASRLMFHPFKSHEGLANLACWWDCYGYMSTLSYPINRYDDKVVFTAEVHERFTQLCGEIVNRRFEVCFGADVEYDEAALVEQYLLVKHNVFHQLLDDEAKKRHGDAYLKKKFDGYALYERVAKMSTKDMHDFFEAKAAAKAKWDEACRKKNPVTEPKLDGLFGSSCESAKDGGT